MKNTIGVLIAAMMGMLTVMITNTSAIAQDSFETKQQTYIEPLQLYVGSLKTTNLIFSTAIKSVDRGTRDVLVQKAKNVENILQVKAAKDSFEQTNLTVVTADGAIHSFSVAYMENPTLLNIEIAPQSTESPLAVFSQSRDFNAKLSENSEKILWRNTKVQRKSTKYGMGIALTGVYSDDDLLYFKFNVSNSSNLDFELDHIRFYIKDLKRAKRTATQTIELSPEYIHGFNHLIYGRSEKRMVAVLKRFNIPDKKELLIELMEKNGGRHLLLPVKNKSLFKSSKIR